jgi:rapid alkalinization factor (RALF)
MHKWILGLCLGMAAGGCVMGSEDGAASGDATGETTDAKSDIDYISYGGISGDRSPCPSGQVMSTATHKCVPTPPSIYQRGCTAQTHCSRG